MGAAGVTAQSPWDLVNARHSYRSAVPILIDWLDRVEAEVPETEREKFREGLVRSLAVKAARGIAGPALVREFCRPGSTADYRWAVGNALEVVAGDEEVEDLVKLARDRRFGRDRQMVVLALARTTDPRAIDALTELLEDDDVAGHAVMALGRLKAHEARAAVARMVDHPKPWIRREARKALARIGE
jgi:HEAT repeat protein